MTAAQIALSAPAVDGRVAVQHLAPESAARHAEYVVAARHRREVAGDQQRAAFAGGKAQKAYDAVLGVVGIAPGKPGGIEIALILRGRRAVAAIEVAHPGLNAA